MAHVASCGRCVVGACCSPPASSTSKRRTRSCGCCSPTTLELPTSRLTYQSSHSRLASSCHRIFSRPFLQPCSPHQQPSLLLLSPPPRRPRPPPLVGLRAILCPLLPGRLSPIRPPPAWLRSMAALHWTARSVSQWPTMAMRSRRLPSDRSHRRAVCTSFAPSPPAAAEPSQRPSPTCRTSLPSSTQPASTPLRPPATVRPWTPPSIARAAACLPPLLTAQTRTLQRSRSTVRQMASRRRACYHFELGRAYSNFVHPALIPQTHLLVQSSIVPLLSCCLVAHSSFVTIAFIHSLLSIRGGRLMLC